MHPPSIPLVDLQPQHAEVATEIAAGWAAVVDASAFIFGPQVEAFEREFASFQGVSHCVGVANGTDALELSLRAAGIIHGDEVILPANTFAATGMAVIRAGAVPVLADCDPEYLLLDPADIERRLTARTRAVIPVHLFGQMAPMELIEKAISGREIVLVEDAAQSQGARRGGTGAGAWGVAAGTSFYPGKNLGAYGDAGGVLTNSPDIDQKIRALRNYGSEVKYQHPEIGFNSRLDTLQAVVLSAKLRHLRKWNLARAEAAARYDELLRQLEGRVQRPQTLPGNDHVWHLYVVRVKDRDRVLERLHARGIGAGVHYPTPLHMQEAFAQLGYSPGTFPVAERASREILSLPIFPGISSTQQERVVDELKLALG